MLLSMLVLRSGIKKNKFLKKKLPLRVSPTVSYNALRNQAEEKCKIFHSIYKDGSKALFLPGPKKESFTLSRYQEEVGKDFKRITLYLCSTYD